MLILLHFPACQSESAKAASHPGSHDLGTLSDIHMLSSSSSLWTRSHKGSLTVAERQWAWVNICLCRAAYLVEIYWLLQACQCDHFETGEAPKKDARTRQPVSAKCHLPPAEILGYLQCKLPASLPGRSFISRDGLTLLCRFLLVWPVASFVQDKGCKRADAEGSSLLPDKLDAKPR